ncbi:CLUMA_CG005816, isoform A [Clunio marinus]|uniref:CLUMA_CG005816, isoform A n=1 Tax=Clunio marinus TaxID=568069 RepID=A0A1J1HVY4_9DIPT|nr:CLUMA_CG005816, isoform A [Clunio marinus]
MFTEKATKRENKSLLTQNFLPVILALRIMVRQPKNNKKKYPFPKPYFKLIYVEAILHVRVVEVENVRKAIMIGKGAKVVATPSVEQYRKLTRKEGEGWWMKFITLPLCTFNDTQQNWALLLSAEKAMKIN